MAKSDALPQDPSVPALSPSFLQSQRGCWYSSPTYTTEDLKCSSTVFFSVANALLRNPNLNSTYLFRADIIWDSAGELETPSQLESHLQSESLKNCGQLEPSDMLKFASVDFNGFSLERTVVRKLIPRKPQLDPTLDQTCHIYKGATSKVHRVSESKGSKPHISEEWLIVYNPHITTLEKMPWYHPPVRALAFYLEICQSSANAQMMSVLSLHILPFDSISLDPVPNRLHRTLLSLLSTYSRLCRNTPELKVSSAKEAVFPNPYKDNIIPQHIHQNTYTRLKETYAARLIADWVEKTEPSKHVFEDLSIAAFLIELWRQMYTVKPNFERQSDSYTDFPGFVDIACGNGVLAHILISEGYSGWGFDARPRKTWAIFPDSTQSHLKQLMCLPRPFADVLLRTENVTIASHDGIFPKDTFIISNHADELTPWTPIIATLSHPESPLPFLAIPCCSHALSGAKHRYSHPKSAGAPSGARAGTVDEQQPQTGDLKALRASKMHQSKNGQIQDSTYGSLCQHVQHLAQDLGYEVERTLMRIPSTRNVGLLGRRFNRERDVENVERKIQSIIVKECEQAGGVEDAARLFYERILGLQRGQGRGKLKGGAGH